jgi:hypothetical protein
LSDLARVLRRCTCTDDDESIAGSNASSMMESARTAMSASEQTRKALLVRLERRIVFSRWSMRKAVSFWKEYHKRPIFPVLSGRSHDAHTMIIKTVPNWNSAGIIAAGHHKKDGFS